ncbi:MAG: flagellar basal body protein [Candidatus Margulisiibacteriota bacterium]
MNEDYNVNSIFGGNYTQLENAMKIATARQEIISQNIANVNTPGYEALDFDAQLMKAVKRQNEKRVILEQEMAALVQNSTDYSTLAKIYTSKLGTLRTIARQGR